MSVLSGLGADVKTAFGTLTGADPKGSTLGQITHALRNDYDWNPESWFGGGSTGNLAEEAAKAEQKATEDTGPKANISTKPPTDKAGETPEDYTLEKGAELPKGLEGTGELSTAESLTDKEYEALVDQADKGNSLATALLKEYKPKYGPTAAQFEQGLVSPFVKQLQSLPGELGPLEAQQNALYNAPGVGLGAADQIAQTYSGIAPQPENATTQAINAEFQNDVAGAAADLKPEEQGLTDLGKAAKLSEKTFPYQSLVEDLLNRYAYQVESPSYQPTATNYPGLPDWLKKLFTGSTGVALGGGSNVSNIGAPSPIPLAPDTPPANTAGG